MHDVASTANETKRRAELRAGFTLIELSIVLVIIGFIVGGVLVGQSLIHSAALNKIHTEVESYRTATNTFLVKYQCLPGDCANATNFLGTNSLGCAAWPPNPGWATGTCNGDGNSQINYAPEGYLAWQQLGMAGLIAGNYSGGGTISVIGINVPASAYSPAVGYSFNYAYFSGSYSGTGIPGDALSNRLVLGMQSNPWTYGPFLSVTDIYSMDVKFDDGLPASGRITVNDIGAGGLCAFLGSATIDPSTHYNQPSSSILCNVVFTLDQ